MSKVMSPGSGISISTTSHLADVASATTLGHQSVVSAQIDLGFRNCYPDSWQDYSFK